MGQNVPPGLDRVKCGVTVVDQVTFGIMLGYCTCISGNFRYNVHVIFGDFGATDLIPDYMIPKILYIEKLLLGVPLVTSIVLTSLQPCWKV